MIRILTPAIVGAASVALAACHQPIKVNPPPPPAEWMQCDKLTARPDLRPLEAITMPDGRRVYLKADVDARDGQIARYVVAVEGNWYSCASQLGKVREYYELTE